MKYTFNEKYNLQKREESFPCKNDSIENKWLKKYFFFADTKKKVAWQSPEIAANMCVDATS